MKRSLLLAAVIVLAGMSLVYASHFIDVLPPASATGCVPVSNGYDYNCSTDSGAPVIQSSAPVMLYGRTLTQINSLKPVGVGTIIYCTNCSNSAICVSTSTSAGGWVAAMSSGTVVGIPHCN